MSNGFRYYYRNRPPGIGCQPDGFTETQTWLPKKKVPDHMGNDTLYFGWVEYPDRLPFAQAWLFELWPWDTLEAAQFMAWEMFKMAPKHENTLSIFTSYVDYLAEGPPEEMDMWGNKFVQIIELMKTCGITDVMGLLKKIKEDFDSDEN